jgi:succinyl-diaminopimelate desuccinylase
MTHIDDIKAYVDEVWEDVVAGIARLVAIDSVEQPDLAREGAPWGPGVAAGLDEALSMCAELGLETTNLDGYIGWGDLPGEDDQTLATIAHVDIVPAATGWDTDPFEVVRRDGYLLGRGVADDKGPLALSIYAAKYFVDKGVKPRHTLRVIVGANEETGMADVAHYLSAKGEPDFLFTPDATFPVSCGEKGVWRAKLVSDKPFGERILELESGVAANAIPATAYAKVVADAAALDPADDIEVVDAGDGTVRIEVAGVGGHASMPEGTDSALAKLVAYLLREGIYGDDEYGPLAFLADVHAAYDGSVVGVDAVDDVFDPLTIVNGVAHIVDGHLEAWLDSRYPKSTSGEKIEAVLVPELAEHGLELADSHDVVPFFISPDSAEIQTLLATYNDHTGEDAQAFTMGGGTYARHFKRAASFGPEAQEDPDKPEWVGCMHGGNEGVSEAQLKMALAIYIDAIERLMGIDLNG